MAGKVIQLGILLKLLDKVTGPAAKVTQSLKNITNAANMADKAARLTNFGNKMLLQATLLNQATGVMRRGFDTVIGDFGSLEAAAIAFQTVATPLGGSLEKAMDYAINKGVEFSHKHQQSAAEYVQAAYQMGSAGLDTVRAIEATNMGMKVATATFGDSREAALLLAVVYKNLGRETGDVQTEMTRLGDLLTVTQQKFLFPSLQPLIEGMKYAAPAAKGSRVALEQLLPIIGMLNTAGLQGSMAGTAFRQSLARIVPASKKLGIALKMTKEGNLDLIGFMERLHRKYGDIASAAPEIRNKIMMAFGGVRGFELFQLLSGQEATLRNYERAMIKSGGVTERTVAKIEMGQNVRLKIMFNNIVNLASQIGSVMAPAIKKVADFAGFLAESFRRMNERYPVFSKFIGAFLGLGAVIATIVTPIIFFIGSISLFGGLTLGLLSKIPFAFFAVKYAAVLMGNSIVAAVAKASAAIWTFMATNPIGWILLAISAIVLFAIAWKKNWYGIGDFMNKVISGIVSGFTWLWNQIMAVVKFIISLPSKFWEAGKNLVLSLWEGIKHYAMLPVQAVIDIAKKIRDLWPFSPAKEGPLKDIDKAGAGMINQIVYGLERNTGRLKTAALNAGTVAAIGLYSPFMAPGDIAQPLIPKAFAMQHELKAVSGAPSFIEPFLRGTTAPVAKPIKTTAGAGTVVPTGGGLEGFGEGIGTEGGMGVSSMIIYVTQHFEQGSVIVKGENIDAESFRKIMGKVFKEELG